MSEQIDWSQAPEGATHYYQITEEWYLAGDGCVPRVWAGMWCKAFQFAQREHECIKRPTTQSWSGEGLPPVGVVCEAFYMGHPQGVVTVRYSGQCMILWSEDRMSEQCGQADHYFFKPIRTQEQIAADAREAAVNDMHAIYMKGAVHGGGLYAIYDAGYRKP